jgi:SAM-dependent methyltransferase
MDPPLTVSGWLRYEIIRRRFRRLGIRSILEIGPGIGAVAVRLAREYDYVGVEIDPESAGIARRRLAKAGRGRVVTGTPKDIDGVFDVVCAFEVLEHIEDDAATLRDWREHILPGGWLALSVPAWPSRWGDHDARAGHFRRYDRDLTLSLLEEAGYERREVISYGFPLLTMLQPVWDALSGRAAKAPTLQERTEASGRFRQPPAWSGYVTRAFSIPFAVMQRPFVRTRLGTGFVVFAQRAD